ncbi:hypothetical protein BGZ94_004973 [Podila epigama]|nr:hypothetical protein BGZ94_004973 [Podila epigama]
MSGNHTKELHDPAVETDLNHAQLEDTAASSAILLEKADFESGPSPDVSSLSSSAILAEKEDEDDDEGHVLVSGQVKPTVEAKHAKSGNNQHTPIPTHSNAHLHSNAPQSLPTATTTALTTIDLNQTMPWKLFYPIASRETILGLVKATAINFMLPFINGVFLGFGEICAHELAYRWGWTHSTQVIKVAGRGSPQVSNVGLRGSGSGGRSGIGGLSAYEDEISSQYNTTTSTSSSYSY